MSEINLNFCINKTSLIVRKLYTDVTGESNFNSDNYQSFITTLNHWVVVNNNVTPSGYIIYPTSAEIKEYLALENAFKEKTITEEETQSQKQTQQLTQTTIPSAQQIYNQLGNKTQSENVVIDEVNGRKPAVNNIKLFDSSNKILKKGSVVEYNGKKYLFWNNNNGKAQLINTDGSKFSGTPNINKLKVLGNYKTTIYNNTEYIVTDNNNVYSAATGNLVYTGKDNSSKTQKQRIIDSAKSQINQPSKPIVAYRTKGNNFLEAFEKDNAIGNPFSHAGYSLYKSDTIKDAVKDFISWLTGEKHTDKLQDYRQAIINKIPELRGKQIFYYKDLNQPSHATALDYIINKYDQQLTQTKLPPSAQQFPNKPEFNKLPSYQVGQKNMVYAGIGSRKTPVALQAQMKEVATMLEKAGYTLRSGAAEGADKAFETGVSSKKEIFLAKDANETTRKIAKEIHPNPSALTAFPLNLMARNTNQIFGKNLDTPVDFVLAWTPDGITDYKQRTIKSGGTGQAIDMASRKGIPVINLTNPNWRNQLEKLLKQPEVKQTEQVFKKEINETTPLENRRKVSLKTNELIPGKDATYTSKALQYFNSAFFTGLKGRYSNELHSLFDSSSEYNKKVYENLILYVYKEMINHFRYRYTAYTNETNVTKKANLAKIIENYAGLINFKDAGKGVVESFTSISQITAPGFQKLVKLHADYMKKLGIEASVNVNSQEHLSDVGETTSKDSADMWHIESLKFSFKDTASNSIRLLFQGIENEKRIDGKDVRVLNEYFGVRDFVDAGKLFGVVANLVANSKDGIQVIERLKAEKNNVAGLNQLLNIITAGGKTPVNMSKSELRTYMDFMQTFRKHSNKYYFAELDAHGALKLQDGVVNSQSKKLLANWYSNSLRKKDTSFYKINKNGTIVYDIDYFAKYFGDKPNEAIEKVELTEEQQLAVIRGGSKRYFQYVNILEQVFGIEVGVTFPPTDRIKSQEFRHAVNSIILHITKGRTDRNILGLEGDTTNYLKPIINHVIENTQDDADNNYYNFTGETQHVIQLHSFLTTIEDTINNVETVDELYLRLPHLASTFTSDSSILFDMLFKDGKRTEKTLDMVFMEGIKSNERKKPFDKLTIADKLSFIVGGSNLGIHSFFRAGDNSLERSYFGYDFVEMYGGNEVREKILEYVITEIDFFNEMNNTSLDEYKGMRNLNHTHSQLDSIFIANPALAKKFDEFVNKDFSVEQANLFKKQLKVAFNSYVTQQANELKQFALQQRLIYLKGNIYVNNGLVGLTKGSATEFNTEQLNNVLTKAIFNRAMWNFEQAKIFTGHPAFYASADNFYKRMSMSVGTKNTPLVDVSMLQAYEKHFPRATSQKRNYFFEGEVINTLPNSDYYDAVYSVAILNDLNVPSKVLTEIKDMNVADSDVYGGMNEADAFAWWTLDSYRDILLHNGMWTEGSEMLYQWVNRTSDSISFTKENGETITITSQEQIKNNDGSLVTFNPIKPQSYGPNLDSRFIPSGYKLAGMPIIPAIANKLNSEGNPAYPNMQKAYKFLLDNNVDMLTTPSANKFGQKTVDGVTPEFYNDEGMVNIENALIQHSFAKYWGIQLNTGNSNKIDKKKVSGTQPGKIQLHNLYEFGEVKDGSEEIKEAVAEYFKYKKALIDFEAKKILKRLDVDSLENATKEQLESVVRMFKDETLRNAPAQNVVDALEMLPDFVDIGFGLDVLANRDKIENILMAMANNRVVKNPVRGLLGIQVPQTLWEGTRRYFDDNINRKANELNFDPKTGVMEVYMSSIFKEFFGQEINLTKVDSKLLEGLGFRIPTSGTNSITKIVIKGFTDSAYGDMVILPSEVVAMMGSDFDVDKLTIFLANYKPIYKAHNYKDARNFFYEMLQDEGTLVEKAQLIADILNDDAYSTELDNWKTTSKEQREAKFKEKFKELVESSPKLLFNDVNPLSQFYIEKYGIGELQELKFFEPDTKTRKGIENGLLLSQLKLMELTDKQSQITPIGISLFKKMEGEITPHLFDAVGKGSYADLTFNLVYQTKVVERNTSSKNLVGVEALVTTDQAFTQLYDIKMNTAKHKLFFPEGSYHSDADGNIRLGGIRDAKGNQLITEAFNQMVNAAVDGAKDPIFFNLNFNAETAPVWNYLKKAGVPFEGLAYFMNQPIIRRYVQLQMIKNSLVNQNIENEADGKLTKKAINKLIATEFGSSISPDIISFEQMEANVKGNINNPIQRKLLEDYKEYEKSAKAYNTLIQATRLDTAGQGKNTSELDLKIRAVEKVLASDDFINVDRLFATVGIKKEVKSKEVKVKDGVEELFDSNLELANQVYEALGFKQNNKNIEILKSNYTRQSVQKDSDSLYLFTDNAQRTSRPTATEENVDKNGWYYKKYKSQTDKPLHFGSTSNPTSAVIRGLNNAYPISTMSAYGTNWKDSNFDLFKETISDEIAQIKKDLIKFNTVKIGNYRIGQGGRFAKLPEQHQKFLDAKLLEIGIDNTGTTPKLNNNQITPQQKQQALKAYSQYLDTIFPESKVKDIVRHDTDNNFWEGELPNGKDFKSKRGIYFNATSGNEGGFVAAFYKIKAIINLTNPAIKDMDNDYAGQNTNELYPNNDGVIGYTESPEEIGEYIVSKPEQIHILGSKQDIEGFKEYKKSAKVEEVVNTTNEDGSFIDNNLQQGYIGLYYQTLRDLRDAYTPLFAHYKLKESSYFESYNRFIDYVLSDKFEYVSDKDKVKLLDNFKSDFISSILLNNDISIYDGKPFGKIGTMVKDLMSSENSVARELDAYKEFTTNKLVHDLLPSFGEQQFDIGGEKIFIDNIKMFDQRLPVLEQDLYTQAFRELFEENPTLAKRLVAVTLLQSGLKLSPMTYTKLIPAEIYMDIFKSVHDFNAIDGQLPALAGNPFIQLFHVNNYKDNNLVPLATMRKGKLEFSGPIAKRFKLLPEYVSANDVEKKTWDNTKRRKYELLPEIIIRPSQDNTGFFTDRFDTNFDYIVDLQAIYDMGSNTSLLSYSSPLIVRKIGNKELSESHVERIERANSEVSLFQYINCKPS
jgi:hypothetical protein